MIKGITEDEYKIIKGILNDYPGRYYAYGSRVRGDFTKLSDLDILVKSPNYTDFIWDLKNRFDNSSLPYVVNFTDFETIDKKFYNLIKADLTRL